MKRIFVLWFFCSIVLLLGCSMQQAQRRENKIKPSQDIYTWDFGKVREGEILKHKFILKNESHKILNIKDVNTSCGCIVSEVEKRSLSPGENTVIKVKFNSRGYSGPTQQYVYVHTDNLDNPVIRFIIKAEVVKAVDSPQKKEKWDLSLRS